MENKPINTGTIDLEAQYKKFQNVLKDAKKGQVVTRFPPEPSGYMHIGHAKASLINYHYSRIYDGKMILRFDDTNPTKEKDEYVQSITEDLKTLGVTYDRLTHTSDYFDKLMEIMTDLIKQGKCYCDNTPVEKMREERFEGIESKCRLNNTVEENLKIWDQMIKGEVSDYCVRGKGNMKNLNKCMRDPVFYRSSKEAHHRTGTKYKIYPTYDFACPIVDSLEDVTHTMRTNEYSDRIDQYYWVLELTGLRKPTIYEFSRLNFVRTVLSKRKLQWFVDTKRVDGWDDPRFPTVRGILRRGIQVETLIEYMLEQGPSKNTTLQQWDKLWAINQGYVDPKAPRFTAISKEKICTLILSGDKYSGVPQVFEVPVHPKRPDLGNRPQFRTNELYLEYEDASILKEGEKITLMKWGNCTISSITPQGDALLLKADLNEDDKDFKTTKKINWLPKTDTLVDVDLIEYDMLITVDKLEENQVFEDVLTPQTRFVTQAFADPYAKSLEKTNVLQFERRGYYIIDKVNRDGETRKLEAIYIPDGKSKGMSNLKTKVDVKELTLGTKAELGATQNKGEKAPEETKEAKESKKKEKKEKKEKGEKPEKPEGEGEKTEAKAEKTEVKAEKAEKAEKPKADPKDVKVEETKTAEVTLADFAKLDIRVGRITECWEHPDSDKLYCEKIDIGGEVRQIGSGLRKFVAKDDMTKDFVLVLQNLKGRKLAGFESTGMVICAGNADHTQVELMRPQNGSVLGERVVLDGFDGVPQDKEKPLDPKKKVLETVLPHLKTDEEGYAVFLGKKLKTSAGYLIQSNLKNAHLS